MFLAEIFDEAFQQLQVEGLHVPGSFHEALWIPIGKVENPTTLKDVRDLELPNEDRKVLSRMVSLLLDEAGAPSLHSAQQAFFRQRDIMRNVAGMNERFYDAHERRILHAFLCLDCSKGYNLMSWQFVREVLTKAGLLPCMVALVMNLVEGAMAFLFLAGTAHVLNSLHFPSIRS